MLEQLNTTPIMERIRRRIPRGIQFLKISAAGLDESLIDRAAILLENGLAEPPDVCADESELFSEKTIWVVEDEYYSMRWYHPTVNGCDCTAFRTAGGVCVHTVLVRLALECLRIDDARRAGLEIFRPRLIADIRRADDADDKRERRHRNRKLIRLDRAGRGADDGN